LSADLGKFDVIFAGNLIDRLYDPEAFLRSIVTFLTDKSILVLTSPYSWLEDYTKV
jgi:2-polyprenyl-3-methyl-5-hydroxy-6-metoxy-1,4-benzoquinol methylase